MLILTLLELATTESQRCSGTCQYSTERKCTDATISRVYRNLGVLEAEGVLEALRNLALTVPDIDGNRIGLHGWSYGGFLTIAAMTSQMVGRRWNRRMNKSFSNSGESSQVRCGRGASN